MRAALPLGLALAVLATGCGDDDCNDLFGSAGESLSLAFDEVTVQWVPDVEVLRVLYKTGSGEQPAIFSVDLTGRAPASGLSVDLAEEVGDPGRELPRGNVERATRDGQSFGALEQGTLTLDAWNGPDGRAEGSVGARFDDGRSLNGDFCAEVTGLGG